MDGAGQDGGWRHNTRGWEGNCHEADYYAGGALGAAGWKPARATPGYFSQMVTGGALTIPTVRAAAVSPGATKPAGMRALICSTPIIDRKSTRLNSSHLVISYAVFCLKKKKET